MSDIFAWTRPASFAALAALAAGCAPVQTPPVATGTAATAIAGPVAGWYAQNGARAILQPCGAAEQLAIMDGAELRRRAAEFGLQDGDPVYVRVDGDRTSAGFRVARVEQFGSPVPVRDCPMTGTSIQQ